MMCVQKCDNKGCPTCSPEEHKEECVEWHPVTQECVCDRLPPPCENEDEEG